jgi:hypothetical protein
MSDQDWSELEAGFFTDGETLSESRTAPEDYSWLAADSPPPSPSVRERALVVLHAALALIRRARPRRAQREGRPVPVRPSSSSPRPRRLVRAATTTLSRVSVLVRAALDALRATRARLDDLIARASTAVDAATRRFEEAELFSVIMPKHRVRVVGVVIALSVTLTAALASAR